jgi:MFS family permease/quinol monooxygenase YgiN
MTDSVSPPGSASHAPRSVVSAAAPLRRAIFRWLWVAGVASNVGTWMHEVGAGWLMTDLAGGGAAHAAGNATDGARMLVSLVQAATTLPLFLLAIPAGALADVFDRRRVLIFAQGWMMLVAAALAFLSHRGAIEPGELLLLTLALGVGAAISNPAWQTLMTDLVPREELPAASALNSVSLNLSRAIGPALGGLIVASLGAWATFTVNAASFVGVLAVLATWRTAPVTSQMQGERFFGAMKAGVRYVMHSPAMIGVLVRTVAFAVFASSLWALMPLIARQHLSMGANGYGILFGSLGVGAVASVLILQRVLARLGRHTLMLGASALYACMLVAMAFTTVGWLGCVIMLFVGAAWITVIMCVNVSAQSGTPAWVRARGMGCYLAVFYGSMALGSVVWGWIASRVGIPGTLLISAAGIFIAPLLTWRYKLHDIAAADLSHVRHWEDPDTTHPIDPQAGPVVITIEYRVSPENADAFREAMRPVSVTRYRDGAISWLLSRDTEDPTRWLEVFIVETWEEHLRQHDRVTEADRRVQQHAKNFQISDKPVVSHWIAAG